MKTITKAIWQTLWAQTFWFYVAIILLVYPFFVEVSELEEVIMPLAALVSAGLNEVLLTLRGNI